MKSSSVLTNLQLKQTKMFPVLEPNDHCGHTNEYWRLVQGILSVPGIAGYEWVPTY